MLNRDETRIFSRSRQDLESMLSIENIKILENIEIYEKFEILKNFKNPNLDFNFIGIFKCNNVK